MKKQPKDLITWEDYKKMLPELEVIEVHETEPEYVPFSPCATPFKRKKETPQA